MCKVKFLKATRARAAAFLAMCQTLGMSYLPTDRKGQIGDLAMELGAAAIIIGIVLYIVGSVFGALPAPGAVGSAAENAFTSVQTNIYTGLQLLGVGIIVAAAMGLIGLIVWRRRQE